MHSLDEPKIIIYPINTGVVCLQFCSFSSSHPFTLICLSSWIFYRAAMGNLSVAEWNSKKVSVGWIRGFNYNFLCLFLFCFFNVKQHKGKPIYRRTLWQWMRFGFLNKSDLMEPQGPLLHIFFHRTKAQRLLYWFLSTSQRKTERQKKNWQKKENKEQNNGM